MVNEDSASYLISVPANQLSSSTLDKLIEAYVLREGTDYGHQDFSLEDKVLQVKRQFERSELEIIYDSREESFDIRPKNWRLRSK